MTRGKGGKFAAGNQAAAKAETLVLVPLRLRADQKAALDALAAKWGIKPNEVARRVLDAGLAVIEDLQ